MDVTREIPWVNCEDEQCKGWVTQEDDCLGQELVAPVVGRFEKLPGIPGSVLGQRIWP